MRESGGDDFIDIYEAREYSDSTVGKSLRKPMIFAFTVRFG